MLGLFTDFVPKHAKQYATLGETIKQAFIDYAGEVRSGDFPTSEHSFTMNEDVLEELTVLQ